MGNLQEHFPLIYNKDKIEKWRNGPNELEEDFPSIFLVKDLIGGLKELAQETPGACRWLSMKI